MALDNLLSGLISSKTRVKLLMRFFLNPQTRSYLRELAKDFNVSTNAVREELNQMTKTHLLKTEKNGRHVYYTANTAHALFPEIRSMISKVIGVDRVIGGITAQPLNVERIYLMDDYAEGKDTGLMDVLLVGNVDQNQLHNVLSDIERSINKKIRHLVLNRDELESFKSHLTSRRCILIWDVNCK